MSQRVVVLIASDRGYQGLTKDVSGKKIKEICQQNHFEVVKTILLPDDYTCLSQKMAEIADSHQADLILTTGGTGLAPRDCMPEATLAIAEKHVPGFSEAIRQYSLQLTKRAMLSRGVSVIRKKTLIINLPGSPKAVEESLTYIIDQLPHALGLLEDKKDENTRH